MNGILAVNKPVGMTSHDVVDLVRKKTGVKRVGHGGTLDPLASGVLVIAVGRENTKKLNEFVKGEKEYVAQIMLGYESETDDEEGLKTEMNTKLKPKLKEVEQTLKQFVGTILQTPPIYSSIKLSGAPAHRRVRRGQVVKIKPREVEIKEIKLLSYEYPVIKIRVITGPGVYIRSLARDIGKKLKTGAYMSGLLRTRVAEFTIEYAIKVENFR